MIVVTGGAGFIGSNLVAALEARGAGPVAVCDRPSDDGKWRNLAKRSLAAVVAPEDLDAFLAGNRRAIAFVFHLGAISSTTERNVELILANNLTPTLRLWQWCAEAGVGLVYASSAAVYGDGTQGFDDDPDPAALGRLRPLNPYGWSKLLADRRILSLARQGVRPPRWAGLRFFNVYGPNEQHKGAMQSVVTRNYPLAAAGKTVTLFRSHRAGIPDGGQQRDFVYVKDCVDVMLWLMERQDAAGIFNLGTGRARSFAELATALFRACGREPAIAYRDTPEDVRAHYQYFTQARMERLRAAGYDRPFAAIEDGIADYVANHLSRADPFA